MHNCRARGRREQRSCRSDSAASMWPVRHLPVSPFFDTDAELVDRGGQEFVEVGIRLDAELALAGPEVCLALPAAGLLAQDLDLLTRDRSVPRTPPGLG
jgi:hypothetical protein